MPKKITTKIGEYFDCYPFTHEQAFRVKDILERQFDPASVERFICELRDSCEGAACLLDQDDFKTYKNSRKSMLSFLKKCRVLLNSIREGKGPVYHLSNFSKLLNETRGELELECQELAVVTGDLLAMLIRKMERLDDLNETRLPGRPNADNKGIVAEIAKSWKACFSKKPTKHTDDPFTEVVQIVFEGLNLPWQYPQRKIRDALKAK